MVNEIQIQQAIGIEVRRNNFAGMYLAWDGRAKESAGGVDVTRAGFLEGVNRRRRGCVVSRRNDDLKLPVPIEIDILTGVEVGAGYAVGG